MVGGVFINVPVDDYLTNGNSIYYQAEYRDDSPITYMLFEYSEDGINWVVVNPTNTEPSKGGDNTYYFSGNFDVSWVTEKICRSELL